MNETNFSVGDPVWSPLFGHGKVVRMKEDGVFPVVVEYPDWEEDQVVFTADGKYFEDSPVPVLFHQEIKDWPNPQKCPYRVGEWVEVWDTDKGGLAVRFAKFVGDRLKDSRGITWSNHQKLDLTN